MRFGMAAFFLWADFFCATAFGGFNGEQRPVAFRAGFFHWLVPDGIGAVGIGGAGIEYFSVT